MISEEDFRRAASASLRNAAALYEDASLLFGAHSYARCLSLSVIGMEEIGKAILYALTALDGLTDPRRELERPKGNPAHLHASKQLLYEYAGIAYWQIHEYLQIVSQESGEAASVSDVEWLTELFVTLILDPSCRAILLKPNKTPGVSDLEQRKQRGLYVDLSPESILSTPEQIDAKEAECELADLKHSLNDLSRFSRVVESADEWHLLKEAVHDRVTLA